MKVGDEYRYLGGLGREGRGSKGKFKKNNIYFIDEIRSVPVIRGRNPVYSRLSINLRSMQFKRLDYPLDLEELQEYFVELRRCLDRKQIKKEI